MELVIREAAPFDYENLCELFDEADKLHADHLSKWFQKPQGPARDKAYILDLLADQAVELFVVEHAGKLLGLVQVVVKDASPMSIFVPRRYVVVDTLVVKEGFRQQGIGQKLMDKLHHWAISKGASDVELNVYEFNQAAIAFYRQLQPSARISLPYSEQKGHNSWSFFTNLVTIVQSSSWPIIPKFPSEFISPLSRIGSITGGGR
jgi:ribosomal protein S18 acetylase RimI-like enzyme